MADRLSIRRSRYDLQPEDEPAHLIDFTIRGARGAIKGSVVEQRRFAVRHWKKLSEELGIDISTIELPEDLHAHN